MSRFSYTEDEDFPGQFYLWQGNCDRSMRSKKGQTELKVLREALLALPEKRLLLEALHDEKDGVCAIGAYAKHKGVDILQCDPEDATDEVGIDAGMPKMVAWKVVEMNDLMYDRETPEERYSKMLNWVESQLLPEPQTEGSH